MVVGGVVVVGSVGGGGVVAGGGGVDRRLGFGRSSLTRPVGRWRPAEEPRVFGPAAAALVVEPVAVGVGAVPWDGVWGAIRSWDVVFPAVGGETTTFAGGGGGGMARDPIGGRCTVPESSSSAIAAAPRRSGSSGTATRRAITQIPRTVSRSAAGNGPFPPSFDPASPRARLTRSRPNGNPPPSRLPLFAENGYISAENLRRRKERALG